MYELLLTPPQDFVLVCDTLKQAITVTCITFLGAHQLMNVRVIY